MHWVEKSWLDISGLVLCLEVGELLCNIKILIYNLIDQKYWFAFEFYVSGKNFEFKIFLQK